MNIFKWFKRTAVSSFIEDKPTFPVVEIPVDRWLRTRPGVDVDRNINPIEVGVYSNKAWIRRRMCAGAFIKSVIGRNARGFEVAFFNDWPNRAGIKTEGEQMAKIQEVARERIGVEVRFIQ